MREMPRFQQPASSTPNRLPIGVSLPCVSHDLKDNNFVGESSMLRSSCCSVCLSVCLFLRMNNFVCSMYAGVINVIIWCQNYLKSQVQEDFHCNEDALFNVFFWLSFGVCLPGVMSLRGKLCYFHVSLVARGYKLLLFLYQCSKNKQSVPMTFEFSSLDYALFTNFCLPLASWSHSVIIWKGNLCYYYVTVSVSASAQPAPTLNGVPSLPCRPISE